VKSKRMYSLDTVMTEKPGKSGANFYFTGLRTIIHTQFRTRKHVEHFFSRKWRETVIKHMSNSTQQQQDDPLNIRARH
jgi:hypothetical protein